MRTKTKYREVKSEIKSPVEEFPIADIPQVTLDGEKAEPVVAASIEAEPEVVQKAIHEAAQADAAALALKQQIAAIRQGEEMQRQQAAHMAAQQSLTPEQKLEMWKANGLSEAEAEFLRKNVELIQMPELTTAAAAEATRQGHQRGSEAHMETTKKLFHEHLARMQEQAMAPATTPAFFEPPAAKLPPPRTAAHFVSAPVSRQVPSGGSRPEVQIDPRRVTLSRDELDIARASGLSPAEYARGKIELERQKRSGERT